LRLDEISPVGIEPISPDVRAAFRVDKLNVNLHPVARPPNAPFEDIVDAQFAPDLLYVNGFALVGEGSGARDYEATGNPREVGGQIVGDAISEIFLVRILRQVLKRQYDD
jgi:hypothetical protein